MIQKIKSKFLNLLALGKRKIKVDLRYLIKSNFWLGIGTAISAISSFVLAVAFANFISPENYGTYKFVLSFYSILAIAGLSGFGSATTRAVARGFEGEFLKNFKIQAIGSTFGTLVAFGISFYYFTHLNPVLGWAFIITGAALPFIESLALYDALLMGKSKFKKMTIFGAVAQITATVAMILATFLGFNVIGLLLVFFGSWIAIRTAVFIYVLKKFKPNSKTEDGTAKLGGHLSLMGVLNNIATYLDRIVLFHFLGAAEVAVYSFAIAPAEQIKGLLKNTNSIAMPRFSQRSEEELKSTMLRKMLLMGIVVGLVIVAYIVASPYIFKILFPRYLSSIGLSQIFAISLLGTVANLPISAMKSLSKLKGLYIYNISSSILTIGLVIVLTPVFGLMGTIIARTISRLI
ncbi:MAG: oligosaccharide flippase family protein, partial [bacterium]|nr:oligosaccharide flippase family protein [bacterium]